MNLAPEKLFVNLYAAGIGPCVGSAYLTKADADRCANSHRLVCVEIAARPADSANGFLVDPVPEVRRAIESYAREHAIPINTAAEEALRAYFMGPWQQ
jgi:hypothetical protein